MGNLVAEQVQSVDLLGQDGSDLVIEIVEEVAYGLGPTSLSVVHGMERGHRWNLRQLVQPVVGRPSGARG